MFEVGQKVICKVFGEGVVTKVDFLTVYQIGVSFLSGGFECYTEGGVEPLRKKAVPVQMPEPDAWRYTTVRGHFRYRGRRVGFATEYPMLKPEPLYTEQQVRAMLSTGVQAQAVPIGWREQFATEVYADLEAAD